MRFLRGPSIWLIFPDGLVTDDQDLGNSAALSISVNVLSQQI